MKSSCFSSQIRQELISGLPSAAASEEDLCAIGRWGEELTWRYLEWEAELCRQNGLGVWEIEWVNKEGESGKPYDIIIMASLWWGRKGIPVAVFLSLSLIVAHLLVKEKYTTIDDYVRALMFIVSRGRRGSERAVHPHQGAHAALQPGPALDTRHQPPYNQGEGPRPPVKRDLRQAGREQELLLRMDRGGGRGLPSGVGRGVRARRRVPHHDRHAGERQPAALRPSRGLPAGRHSHERPADRMRGVPALVAVRGQGADDRPSQPRRPPQRHALGVNSRGPAHGPGRAGALPGDRRRHRVRAGRHRAPGRARGDARGAEGERGAVPDDRRERPLRLLPP